TGLFVSHYCSAVSSYTHRDWKTSEQGKQTVVLRPTPAATDALEGRPWCSATTLHLSLVQAVNRRVNMEGELPELVDQKFKDRIDKAAKI
ncbi:hypothetical protein L9F63_020496, partial [Diploptera punctata]